MFLFFCQTLDLADQKAVDKIMLDLDGTENKGRYHHMRLVNVYVHARMSNKFLLQEVTRYSKTVKIEQMK